MGILKNQEEAREAAWNAKARADKSSCRVCGRTPTYYERETYEDEGLCSDCSANAKNWN